MSVVTSYFRPIMVLPKVCKAKYNSLTKFVAKFESFFTVFFLEDFTQRAPNIENDHIIILKDRSSSAINIYS